MSYEYLLDKDTVKIIFLFHSGFLVETDSSLLLFDYYRDEKNMVAEALKREKKDFYIFSSHAHGDHFNPYILKFQNEATHYFLSDDIKILPAVRNFSPKNLTYVKIYTFLELGKVKLTSFASTDAGTSFLVELDGWKIFHAGDFNWWHWDGDTEENLKFAKNGFFKQLKRMQNLDADIAFFPVDGRLERTREWGAREFVKNTRVKSLVSMHNTGYPKWHPTEDFFEMTRTLPYYAPCKAGEEFFYKRDEGFFLPGEDIR